MNRSKQRRMAKKSIIGVWLIALALVPFRVTHAQQPAKVFKIGFAWDWSLFRFSLLTRGIPESAP